MRSEPTLEESPVRGSASCAPATLDEPSEREIEDVPREDAEDEEPPFTEDEVGQMHEEIRELAAGIYTDKTELNNFLGELDAELQENADLQERGHILLDVLDYLQNPDGGEEGDEGGEYVEGDEDPAQAQAGGAGGAADDDELEPYPGEEGLQELWKELQEVCSEDDIKRLEEELEGKQPEEQWKILMEVYEYLSEEQEQERQDFEAWQPTKADLENSWKEMMSRVPAEDVAEVQVDWKKASFAEKKQMVWDVRKLLDEEGDDDGGDDDAPEPQHADAPKAPPKAPPPPRGGYTDDSKSEVRRRGGGKSRPEPGDLEYDFERAPDGGDWDAYYNKEAKRSKGGRPYLLIGGSLLLLLTLALLLTATLLAEEDQSVMQAAMGLIGVGGSHTAAAEAAEAAAAEAAAPEISASEIPVEAE